MLVSQLSGPVHRLPSTHCTGGPDEDVGIKYNCENGGPAPEKLTDAIYEITRTIKQIKICDQFPDVDLSNTGSYVVRSTDKFHSVVVDVISSTQHHVALLKTIFDFDSIRRLFKRADFSMTYDCMHGVQGPYAHAVLVDELGAPADWMLNNMPKEDFNGAHADPNLT
jgi:phosphoglucomutase